jgi:hypothetical protein
MSASDESRPLRWSAWLRAGLITFALLVHSCYALPSPHTVDEADLATPEGKEEIQRWVDLLGSVGLDITTEQLSQQTMYWTKWFNGWHSTFRRPFRPWMRYTGTGQAWALFANPDTYPHRIEVYVRIDKQWVPIYRRNDPELDWNDDFFRFRRVRGVYDGSTSRQRVPYWNFSRDVAKRAFLDYPDADRVKMQQVRPHPPMPWEPFEPEETVRVKRVFRREAILATDGLAP